MGAIPFSENDKIVQFYSTLGHFLNSSKYLYWINVLTFVLYLMDKLLSVMGCRKVRIPELWLLLLSGLGGAPSAMLAALIFNHKTRKKSYKRSFNWIVVLHILLAAVPYFYQNEYGHSQQSNLFSMVKGSFGALSYYVPFYAVSITIYYTLGPLISLLEIIFSPIIFVVNLIVLVMRFVLFAGLCGVALTLVLSIYQKPEDTFAYIRQQWSSAMGTFMEHRE